MKKLLIAATLAAGLSWPAAAASQAQRSVAVTIDDLPAVGEFPNQPEAFPLDRVRRLNDKLMAALARHQAKSAVFVNERGLFRPGQTDGRIDILRGWRDAGHELANHGFDHADNHQGEPEAFEDEIVRGDTVTRLVLAETGARPRYFRFPYNHVGVGAERKARIEAFLARRGYASVPFTVEHQDYAFAAIWQAAQRDRNADEAKKIRDAYLDQLDIAFDYAERRSKTLFGREVPQIWIIHANELNAETLEAQLDRLKARGYRFVDLSAALKDPAYAAKESYAGDTGMSWLHRWAPLKGMESDLRNEPDPPAWVYKRFNALNK